MPVWHASAAIQPVQPVSSWTRQQRRRVERALADLLEGVGRPAQEFLDDDHPEAVAVHMRRPATVAEEHAVGGARDTRCQHGKGLIIP